MGLPRTDGYIYVIFKPMSWFEAEAFKDDDGDYW